MLQSEKISSAARKLANRQLDQYNEIFSRGSTEEDPTRNIYRGNRRRMEVGREHETPKQLAQHVEKQLENDAEAVSRILAARGKGSRILELKSILEQSLKRVDAIQASRDQQNSQRIPKRQDESGGASEGRQDSQQYPSMRSMLQKYKVRSNLSRVTCCDETSQGLGSKTKT